VGLVVAEEMLHNSIAVFALIPLLGLITMFAQERRHRLQSLLDLNRVQAELSFQAAHDPVTGLANRVTLVGRLEKALATNQRRKERIALLFLDLDGFKQINDKFGHDVGDQLLIAVAKRLESVARDTDTVSRFGGDEFVILCIDLNAQDDAYAIGARFCEALRQPLVVDEQELEVTLSIGVVLADSAHVDAGHLLRQADIAMYQAKHKGRNQVCVLDADVLSEMTPTLGSSPEAKETTPVPALGSRDHCYPQPPAKLHAKSLVLPHSTRTASKSSRSAVPVE
jgi:diguanylate cyclase (GGDEF)-like protein